MEHHLKTKMASVAYKKQSEKTRQEGVYQPQRNQMTFEQNFTVAQRKGNPILRKEERGTDLTCVLKGRIPCKHFRLNGNNSISENEMFCIIE